MRSAPVTESPSLAPTVYVVDDDAGMCDSLRWLVETLGVPVKTFRSGERFLSECHGPLSGCVLLDVRMPGMGGLELQREIRRQGQELPVIILTAYGSVPMVVDALKQGATDFLEKPLDDEILLGKIERALAADSQRCLRTQAEFAARAHLDRLTPRESEVLTHVVQGLSSKQIACRLGVSSKTVEAHRARIMAKMEVTNVAHLICRVMIAQGQGEAERPQVI